MWNAQAAIAYLRQHAAARSLGRCAEYTRKAIESGGVKLLHHRSAKDYGSSLCVAGFRAVTPAPIHLRAGDVAIIQPIPHHPHGHMCMYDGAVWISDFRQLHGFYPGPSYRAQKPPYAIWRNSAASVPASNR